MQLFLVENSIQLGLSMEWGMSHRTLCLGLWSILRQDNPNFKSMRNLVNSLLLKKVNFVHLFINFLSTKFYQSLYLLNLEMTTNPLKYNVNQHRSILNRDLSSDEGDPNGKKNVHLKNPNGKKMYISRNWIRGCLIYPGLKQI